MATKQNHDEYLDKRFNDFKHYSIVFGSIIAALVILFGFNYKSQLDDLRTYKTEMLNEIRNTLGKGSKSPNIILVDPDGKNIENTTVPCFYDTSKSKQGQTWMTLHFIVQNIGEAISGNLWFEYFSKEPLAIGGLPVIDEPEFDWRDFKGPGDHSLGYLPGGGFWKPYSIAFQVHSEKKLPLKSKYPMLIKIYNEGGVLTAVRFKIIISYRRDITDLD